MYNSRLGDVKDKCSKDSMSQDEWIRRGFDDPTTTYLFNTNKEVNLHNLKMLKAHNNPIAKVEAYNSTTKGKSLSPDQFNSLQNTLYLAKGALVLLTTNMWPEGGLANGSTGTVVDIEYDAGTPAPGLPKCVWVDFGSDYTGPTFFSPGDPDHCTKRGWVPIPPATAQAFTRGGNKADWVTHERRMIPLRLAWSWTVWKAQGQTIHGKVVINLGPKEKEHGLAYVAFSRATRFSNIGIIGGLAGDRLTTQISKQKKLKLRVVEDKRLEGLARQVRG
jgi:ATP-dependent DNA helicase PIF1